jgi:hypothetical protein
VAVSFVELAVLIRTCMTNTTPLNNKPNIIANYNRTINYMSKNNKIQEINKKKVLVVIGKRECEEWCNIS